MKVPKRKLPIGIENFEEIRKENFYYVDKTNFIAELLQNWGSSKFVYPSAEIWKIVEYEYAGEFFFRGR